MTALAPVYIPASVSVLLADLVEPPVNPNKMEPDAFDRLQGLIAAKGFLQPILVRRLPSNGDIWQIVDGVHRSRAMRNLGALSIPAVDVTGMSDAECRALQIALNRLRGDLDLSEVARSLVELDGDGWTLAEMSLTGFSEVDITGLLQNANPSDEEIMEGSGAAPPEEPKPEGPAKPFLLELRFADRATFQRVNKALKQAGGKGNKDIVKGLLALLDGSLPPAIVTPRN